MAAVQRLTRLFSPDSRTDQDIQTYTIAVINALFLKAPEEKRQVRPAFSAALTLPRHTCPETGKRLLHSEMFQWARTRACARYFSVGLRDEWVC